MAESIIALPGIIGSGDVKKTLEYLKKDGLTPKICWPPGPHYWRPVTLAVFYGNIHIMETLLSRGYSQSEGCFFEKEGRKYAANPIHLACNNGQTHIVRSLIEDHGVDVNAPDSEGDTPLMYAIHGKMQVHGFLYCSGEFPIVRDPAVCEYLLNKGADVNRRSYSGDTPLHFAVENRRDDILNVLEAGADVNAQNKYEETAFLCVIRSFWLNCDEKACIVNRLCDYGADPNIPDKRGNTGLTYAVRECEYDVVRFLVVDLNVSLETKRYRKVGRKVASIVKEVLRVIENLKTSCQNIPVSDKNYLRCIKLIVRAGFNLGQKMSEYDFESVLDRVQDDDDCIRYLKQKSSNPRTLQELCCFEIRRNLGRRISRLVEFLPLPQKLKDAVLLKTDM